MHVIISFRPGTIAMPQTGSTTVFLFFADKFIGQPPCLYFQNVSDESASVMPLGGITI
jgi:hypothetical protein